MAQSMITSPENLNAHIDETVNALAAISIEHHEVHEGDMFRTFYLFNSIAAGANAEILLRTGTLEEHTKFGVQAQAASITYLMEDVTSTAVGTHMVINNLNRLSSITNTPAMLGWYVPTGVVGTIISTEYVPGGTDGKKLVMGGSVRAQGEWILKKSTDYVVRTTNLGAAASTILIAAEFYEV